MLCDGREQTQQTQNGIFDFVGKSMKTETATWSDFPNRGKAIVEQILASEEINKSKRAGLRVTVKNLSRKEGLSVSSAKFSQYLWWKILWSQTE